GFSNRGSPIDSLSLLASQALRIVPARLSCKAIIVIDGDGVRQNRPYGLMTPTSSRWESVLQNLLLISLGAVIGATLRYLLALYVGRLIPSAFPYGTLVINLSACFILGFFLIWSTERVLIDPRWRPFIAIGICGSYSTYSSYAFETFALFEKGQWAAVAANVAGMNLMCFIAVALGAALARSI